MRYQLTYAALLAVGSALEPSTWTPTAPTPTTTPGKTCAPGLVEGVTGCVPPSPTPKPPFPWSFKDKCLEKCVGLGPWTDAHGLCAPGAYVRVPRDLHPEDDKLFNHNPRTNPNLHHQLPRILQLSAWVDPGQEHGLCETDHLILQHDHRIHDPMHHPRIHDPTPTPSTTITPPYPCGTDCVHSPHPTLVTITTTTTSIETLTYCPHKHTCHGQTTTWTYTEGPTSCAPTVTCTCVLPGYPTLTSCPRSVTCTGQTTTITEGSTVVLPSETLPPHTPAGPTTSPALEFPGAAATKGVGLLAVMAGVVAVL
ncbi:hypothetical protein BCR34DRAFT_590302 [Clohesyomyces aquaticus]|uniref:Uncharacterized protein n=1 Tax=Clohesyomyces aquaticus TaxID=1231657 RepID=A0A1Y1ZAT8_9PLEO|nr:hypothetical protein BCR34DRAFT_590302 [Clohesyomyces aquaticus]